MGIAENMDIQQYMATVGKQARAASRAMARATAGDKNTALSAIAGALRAHRSAILDANQRDLARGRDNGLEAALLDRLELTPERFDGMVGKQLAEVLFKVKSLEANYRARSTETSTSSRQRCRRSCRTRSASSRP